MSKNNKYSPWLICTAISAALFTATATLNSRYPHIQDPATLSLMLATVLIYVATMRHPALVMAYLNNPVEIGRDRSYYRLLAAGFLHATPLHIFFNLFTLYSFAPVVESWMRSTFGHAQGSALLLAFYLSAVVFSNWPTYIKFRDGQKKFSSLGASGAVFAILAAVTLLLPTSKVLLFAVIPVRASLFLLLLLIITAALSQRAKKRPALLDHSAHLSGSVYGVAFMLLLAQIQHIALLSNFIHSFAG